MASMHVGGQGIGEEIGRVIVGVDLHHTHDTMRDVLPNLEVATIDVARATTRLAFFRGFHCAGIVHVQERWRGCHATDFFKQPTKVYNFSGDMLISASVEDNAMQC
eukprot:6204637-Pleurochrysis_carterae.AAC.1